MARKLLLQRDTTNTWLFPKKKIPSLKDFLQEKTRSKTSIRIYRLEHQTFFFKKINKQATFFFYTKHILRHASAYLDSFRASPLTPHTLHINLRFLIGE